MFSSEFCEIFRNTFSTEPLRATVSGLNVLPKIWSQNCSIKGYYLPFAIWPAYKGKWLNSKITIIIIIIIIIIIKWSICHEVLSVTWPNFTLVKQNSKISIIYNQKKETKMGKL